METQTSLLTTVFLGIIHPEIPFPPCTLKLIYKVSFQNKFHESYQNILNFALQTSLPRAIIAEPNLTDINERFQTQKHQRNRTSLYVPKIEALRFSCHVESALIFLEPGLTNQANWPRFVQVNSNYNNYFVRAFIQSPFNISPVFVNHVFIGPLQDLQKVFNLYQIRVLGTKIGLVVENGQVSTQQLVEVPVPFTRTSTLLLKDLLSNPNNDRFHALRSRHFISDSWPTKMHMIVDDNGRGIGGVPFTYLEVLSRYYNFTFEYRFDGYVLKQLEDNSWTGYLGHVMKDLVDLSMFPAQSIQRFPYCDLTQPMLQIGFGIVTPIPRSTVNWKAIFYTFDPPVWALIGLTCAAVIPLFYIGFQSESIDLIGFRSIANPLLMMIRVGVTKLPRHLRQLCAFYLIFCMIIGAFFDSNLTSFLTFPQLENVPQTFEDLNNQRDYRVDFVNYIGGAGTVYLEFNKDPIVAQVVPRMNLVRPKNAEQSVIEMAMEGKSVYFDYQDFGMTALAEYLTIYPGVYPGKVGESIVNFQHCIGLRRYSKYTFGFNKALLRLGATGHFFQWHKDALEILRRKGLAKRKKMALESSEGYAEFTKVHELTMKLLDVPYKPFSLSHLGFSFSTVLIGTFVAALVFSLETFRVKFEGFGGRKRIQNLAEIVNSRGDGCDGCAVDCENTTAIE